MVTLMNTTKDEQKCLDGLDKLGALPDWLAEMLNRFDREIETLKEK